MKRTAPGAFIRRNIDFAHSLCKHCNEKFGYRKTDSDSVDQIEPDNRTYRQEENESHNWSDPKLRKK